VGQRQQALNYAGRLMSENAMGRTGVRQESRNLAILYEAISAHNFRHAALQIALQWANATDRANSVFDKPLAYSSTGEAFAALGEFEQARVWVQRGLSAANSIASAEAREKTAAVATLRLANLERRSGDLANARGHYDDAIAYLAGASMPARLAEARRGLLLVDVAAKNSAAIETGIVANIQLVEQYRDQIAAEAERSGFSDSAKEIYDIAASFEFDRLNLEKAYDYVEKAGSRSLLDWLLKGGKVKRSKASSQMLLNAAAEPVGLEEVRRQMPAGSQVLQFSRAGDRLLIFLVSQDKFVARSVTVDADELKRLVSDMSRSVSQQDENYREIARRLYDMLIAPMRGDLDLQKELCIVPADVLFTLPFSALVSPEGRPLISDLDLVIAPSANVFLYSSKMAETMGSVSAESFFGIGDPSFDREDFKGLPYLPAAVSEVTQAAAQYAPNGTYLTRLNAKKSSVMAQFMKADVVQFASHYVVEPLRPQSSFLLLAAAGDPENSKLTNIELSELRSTRTRLVVLSACQSGTEGYAPAEGLIGITRTFLGMNVPLVVGSQWKVDDEATAKLMVRFHQLRRQGKSTSQSLRSAQLELANDPTGRFTAPHYWAAFAVYGGHAEF
jgi:CHAT domain-containing protein